MTDTAYDVDEPRLIIEPGLAARVAAIAAPVLADIAERKRVEMPIIQAVNAVLTGRANVDTAITELLSRPLKSES